MSKFKVVWSSDKDAEFETSECATADAYAMSRWGMPSAEHVREAYGVQIDLVSEEPTEEPLKEDPPPQ